MCFCPPLEVSVVQSNEHSAHDHLPLVYPTPPTPTPQPLSVSNHECVLPIARPIDKSLHRATLYPSVLTQRLGLDQVHFPGPLRCSKSYPDFRDEMRFSSYPEFSFPSSLLRRGRSRLRNSTTAMRTAKAMNTYRHGRIESYVPTMIQAPTTRAGGGDHKSTAFRTFTWIYGSYGQEITSDGPGGVPNKHTSSTTCQ